MAAGHTEARHTKGPRDWISSPGCMRLYVVMLSSCLLRFMISEQWTGILTAIISPFFDSLLCTGNTS